MLLSFQCLQAQDLETINWKQPVKVTGGFSITNTFYESHGMEARRDPWYWMIGGNINANLFGVLAVPVSFQISQQNKSYTQPFNQFGLSPRYKAWTLHAGYRSLQYSTYTLGGNMWLGAAIEYRPDDAPFFVSVLYGRFQKGVNESGTEGLVSGFPAYERWGYATKVGFQRSGRSFAIQVFRGKDDASSVSDTIAKQANITPAENVVWAITTKQSLSKAIMVDLEYALSAYTLDHRGTASELAGHAYLSNLGTFFHTNNSTKVNSAFQGAIYFNHPMYQLKFSYRRVAPQYRSMGSIFLNNDVEDISAGITWKMLKQKITASLTGGLQRNNLDKKLSQEAARNAFSASLMYAPSQKLNFNAQYSNFLSNTKFNNLNVTANQLNLQQNSDSLRYNQVTQNASLNSTYTIGDSLLKHTLMGTLNWQKARDTRENSSDFYSAMAGYAITFVKSQLGFNLNILSTYNTSNGIVNQLFGPNLGVSKRIRTIRLSFNSAYCSNATDHVNTGYTLTNRLSGGIKQGKHHSFTADINWMKREQKQALYPANSEWRANIVYSYVF